MNDMHFEGTIITAHLHQLVSEGRSSIHLRINYDVTEECMIEVEGTTEELAHQFEVIVIPGSEPDSSSLAGRKCKIVRNAQGYQFLSYIK